mgnify:CR=1 FL=1
MAGVDATDWHNPDAMLSFHRFQRIRNLRLGFAHCCGAVKDGDGIVLLLAGSGERLDDDMTDRHSRSAHGLRWVAGSSVV